MSGEARAKPTFCGRDAPEFVTSSYKVPPAGMHLAFLLPSPPHKHVGMRLPSFQAPFRGKSRISHGNPRTNSGGGKGGGGGGGERQPRVLLTAAAGAGMPGSWAACPRACSWWPVLPLQVWRGGSLPAGCGGWRPPIPIAPLPAPTPGLALRLRLTGLSAPATRRKLFELARAFSEKTRMRKSKRKHLSKHQSYPFRPGAGWGRGR